MACSSQSQILVFFSYENLFRFQSGKLKPVSGCKRPDVCLSKTRAFKCLSFRRSYVLPGMHFFGLPSTLFVNIDMLRGSCENLWKTCVSPFLAAVDEEFISRFEMKADVQIFLAIECCMRFVVWYKTSALVCDMVAFRGRLLRVTLTSVSYLM